MGFLCCAGAQLMCSFGTAPSALVVTPEKKTMSGAPSANIMDMVPMKNILPFGSCTSIKNPVVASATAAKLGVLSPMPCIPVIAGPWAPGNPTVLVGGMPALNNTSKAMCVHAGVIQILNPGQQKALIK